MQIRQYTAKPTKFFVIYDFRCQRSRNGECGSMENVNQWNYK